MDTSRFASSSLHPPPTVDTDIMEISSDTGRDGGYGDIEIDIDFPTVPVDEDSILEDVRPEISYEEDHPASNDDHIMRDDDDQSLDMNDAEPLDDDTNIQLESEAVDMSFYVSDAVPAHAVQSGSDHEVANPANATDELTWETLDEPQQDVNDQIQVSTQETVDNEQLRENVDEPLTEATPAASEVLEDEYEQDELQDYQQYEDQAGQQEEYSEEQREEQTRKSPSPPNESVAAASEQPAENGVHEHDTEFQGSREQSVEEQRSPAQVTHETEDTKSARRDDHNPQDTSNSEAWALSEFSHNIVVFYGQIGYSLLCDSESDDPNNYFLRDTSLFGQPIHDFLLALRNVIDGELPPDDEVCLKVPDLHLEISETSTPSDITFSKIVDLHLLLQRNDNVKEPNTLYLRLETKPDFSKRFATLNMEAANGKGLSGLIGSGEGDVGNEENEALSYDDEETPLAPTEDEQQDEITYSEIPSTQEGQALHQEANIQSGQDPSPVTQVDSGAQVADAQDNHAVQVAEESDELFDYDEVDPEEFPHGEEIEITGSNDGDRHDTEHLSNNEADQESSLDAANMDVEELQGQVADHQQAPTVESTRAPDMVDASYDEVAEHNHSEQFQDGENLQYVDQYANLDDQANEVDVHENEAAEEPSVGNTDASAGNFIDPSGDNGAPQAEDEYDFDEADGEYDESRDAFENLGDDNSYYQVAPVDESNLGDDVQVSTGGAPENVSADHVAEFVESKDDTFTATFDEDEINYDVDLEVPEVPEANSNSNSSVPTLMGDPLDIEDEIGYEDDEDEQVPKVEPISGAQPPPTVVAASVAQVPIVQTPKKPVREGLAASMWSGNNKRQRDDDDFARNTEDSKRVKS